MIDENIIYIIDEFDPRWPTMSVTNDAENVVNHLIENIKWVNQTTRFFYMDTAECIDEIIPKFDNGNCINVNFKVGSEEIINSLK